MKLENPLSWYFAEIERLPEPTKEGLEALWKKAKKGSRAAKKKLAEFNLKLVLPVARRYLRRNIALLDLIEEGNIGLMKAIEKFDPKKKVKFSTYAMYWIDQRIRKAVKEHSRTIRIPPHTWDSLRKWIKNWEQLRSNLGRSPTLTEMTQKLRISPKQGMDLMNTIEISHGLSSLDTPIDENGELFMKDVISDKTSQTPDVLIGALRFKDDLGQALNKMNPRNSKILKLRYGLGGTKKLTLDEVGKKMKISRERVRQIEKRALYQLKWIAHKMKLT